MCLVPQKLKEPKICAAHPTKYAATNQKAEIEFKKTEKKNF
jgi:hypothetical protein